MNFNKEMYNKILSIKNTQKITKAMEMVAASKMKKIKKYMSFIYPYKKQISNIISNITPKHFRDKYLYFKKNNIKYICYIVVSTDRGLVGGLNINLFKKLLIDIKKWKKKKIKLALIGFKAMFFFNSFNIEKILQIVNIGFKPKFSKFIYFINTLIKLYNDNKLDILYIIYNKFVNVLVQIPLIIQILPIKYLFDFKKKWDYLYESNSKLLINTLIVRYIESLIYKSIIENFISEYASRMISMKYATENANILINDYSLIFNKNRQMNITQELSEIFSCI